MLAAAEGLEFERAAALRDKILRMRDRLGEAIEDDVPDERMVGGKQRKRTSKSGSGKGSRVPRPKSE